MKKLLSVLFVICLCISVMPFSAFADLGAPEFDDWFVVVGLDGLDSKVIEENYEVAHPKEANVHVEPGVQMQVYDYDEYNDKYMLIAFEQDLPDPGFSYKPFFHVASWELDNLFIGINETVEKTKGIRQSKEVTGNVNADVGLILRRGPSQRFERITTIPFKAEVKYQFTYKYGGRNWGFTTYNGTNGWICIDYVTVKAAETTTEVPTTEETTAAAETTESTTEEITSELSTVTELTTSAADVYEEKQPDTGKKFSKTGMIIFGCLGYAVILLVVGIVTLIVNKKRREARRYY